MFANKKTHMHKPFLFLYFIVCFCFISVKSQTEASIDSTTYLTISNALNEGKVDIFKDVLYEKTDITLPEQSGIYSKRQAYFILKDFFGKNQPNSFQIINTSFNNGSNFIVGKMHTNNQHYRVCYLTKYTNNNFYIYQIRIEN